MLYEQVLNYQNKLFNIETKEHVENVSRLTLYIARHFDFSDEELFHLGEIAKFHDIGKIKLPKEILERNGPLTDDEWELVKKHPIFGRDILREFGFTDDETIMVHQHHERCNGEGYPLGLTKDEIELEAKIIGIVDIMDALLSDRSYKEGWHPNEVKEFFIKNEEHFCQKIVDIIVNNFEEMLTLRQ